MMSGYFIMFPCSQEVYEWVLSAPDHERRPARSVTVKPCGAWDDDGERYYFICATTTWGLFDTEWIAWLTDKAMRND